MYIAELGWCDWMEEYGDDSDRLVADLRNIYWLAHATFGDLLAAAGLKMTEAARRFDIPYRTIQNWRGGYRQCPDYLKYLMADALGLITVSRTT